MANPHVAVMGTMYVVGVSEADTMTMTVDDVWRTDAGAQLFNGLTAMHLKDQQGNRIYFSRRVEITKRLIGMLLEGGLVPADMTPRMAPPDSLSGTLDGLLEPL